MMITVQTARKEPNVALSLFYSSLGRAGENGVNLSENSSAVWKVCKVLKQATPIPTFSLVYLTKFAQRIVDKVSNRRQSTNNKMEMELTEVVLVYSSILAFLPISTYAVMPTQQSSAALLQYY